MAKELLKVSNLEIEFKTENGIVQAIRGVDFNLHVGETLAIVGESGSGKSVVTRAVMGILANNGVVKAGEILYTDSKGNQVDVTKMSKKELPKIRGGEIAMIFQDPMTALNPVLTIGTQIVEAIQLHQKDENGKDLSKTVAKAKALELLTLVGIHDPEVRFKQYPHQFSGGMRQRIVIAIALGCEPRVLIADEPTTALDVTIQAQILELIKEIQQRLNLAVIFITHDLGVVANVADRVNVMYAGRIVEAGSIDEVFYNPRHPYTWGLLSSMPDIESENAELFSIPGTPPNLLYPPKGDAFAPRNKWALDIDFEMQPPMFKVSENHYAATWLLDPRAPKVDVPEIVLKRVRQHVEGGEN
ncbi:ABC transporter ATP-binding protein [Culicoidibacter larvae]|uniref:ABC transporter ATP-binding protein n=1 Tax=Culicoidibacter larvae TaxID=2579976 RepID=A0A5R8QBA8_9FIRM|nr:ABC transporter ATP-binding protein [Culicoidibacter larvae]TLG73828.1 ABC transporter ATP-binding protein [Culicoidibacter larvae]